jgi:DNA repair exonuclease SbcCD ATPase subunit
MIKFKKIRWKNFLSTGNAWSEVELDQGGTTLIVGVNGAGKTTFADAFSFVNFNKPFRKVVKNKLVNSINGKDCVVEQWFTIGDHEWHVRRGIRPNFFEIYRDGERIEEEDRSATDYQAWYEENVLRFNHKACQQIINLAANKYVPFMSLATGDRRKVVEEVLDILVFSEMNRLLKLRIDESNSEIKEMDRKAQNLRDKVAMQEQFERVMAEDVQSQVRAIDAKQEGLRREKTEKTSRGVDKAKELQDLPYDPAWKDAGDRLNAASLRMNECRTLMRSIEKRLKFFSDHTSCPTCNQGIDPAHAGKIADAEAAEFKRLLAAVREQELLHAEAIEQYGARGSYDKTKNEIKLEMKLLMEGMHHIDRQIVLLDKDKEQVLKKQERVAPVVGESSDEMRLALDSLDNLRKEAYAEKAALQYSSALLKDDGIKSQRIRQYMPRINQMINKYLAELDFYVDFQLDENFAETIKSRHRDEFTYESFSEGEKFRIDIAILFAWRSVARELNSVSTNLLILDEVLDSSLDSSGADEFAKILKRLADTQSTFVISHRGDQLSDKFDRILQVTKVKNFSEIEVQ